MAFWSDAFRDGRTIPATAVALALNWRSGTAVRTPVAAALVAYLAVAAITALGNVPLNGDLAEYANLTPALAEQARVDFVNDWNTLNLLRRLPALACFALLAAALTFPERDRAR